MTARCRGDFGLRGLAVAAALGSVCLGVATLAGPAAAATLHRRFDFETPGFGRAGDRLSDFFILPVAGTWHLFYTDVAADRSDACRIGHATSSDLIHWSERPTVVTADGTGWRASGAWAPHVIARPGGGWMLFYTGQNESGSQAILGLLSNDLDTWTPAAAQPLWTPAGASWARWDSTGAGSCRDPFVWFENGAWSMICTMTTHNGRPALGRVQSTDLFTWTDAGPFAIDSTSLAPVDLESAHLVFDNGRVELLYTRFFVRYLSAATSAGPWNVSAGVTVDSRGAASEKLKSGSAQMLARLRYDFCDPPTALIVIDTVTATAGGYAVPAAPGLPFGWTQEGDAFATGPAFGDGPALRGDGPADPDGFRWAASGETYRLPDDPLVACAAPSRDAQTGWLRSPRFTLLGDSLWFRIMGARSSDSSYVRLSDDCTGLELARRTGPDGSALAPAAWSNAGRRGWPVRLELVDLLERPGGVIGADSFRDSTIGTYSALVPVAINQTAPAGGENLTPGTISSLRWTSSHVAGVDSNVVYVSYDNFATPPQRLQHRNGSQFQWGWTVPAGPRFDVRIRVVAYAKNGVHDCDTSPPFSIAVTTGVPGDPGGAGSGLLLAARDTPGPRPILEWGAPAGTRAWLRLYDVRGRLVRTLVAGEAVGDGGGLRPVSWDGRDGEGRPVPPGVFFALLTGDDGARRRVTVIHLGR